MKVTYEDLADIREQHREETIAYTGGCFDLLHKGHLELLECLREMGRIAVVGVTPDEKVRIRKGPTRPVQDEETRMSVVEALRHVDYAFVTPVTIPEYKFVGAGVLRLLRPDYLLTNDGMWQQDQDWLQEQGTQLVMDTRPDGGVSTTAIIERWLALSQ